ncbi:MmgE/PrpD family protein [Virgibacillus byunsanensis]|uniref:MmgE/PrpD family protein n=1 Tax=Virgibacillus byunsanensis TaxID=570945 RepID=A0ABW3LFZ7_9BACI
MRHIVEWVDYELHTLNEQTENYVKKSLVDFIGVSIAALQEPLYEKIAKYVSVSSNGDVPLLATKDQVSPQHAALALGALSHAIDYDDISVHQIGHPTVVLAPILFTLGYQQKKSGKEIFDAYVAGYEVIARISKSAARTQYEKGWHTTSTIGVLGGTVSAARLLGLSQDQTENAIGIATSLASGLRANFGTMTKPLHAGWAASNAIFAAELAKDNFDSSEEALDGVNSYFQAFGGQIDYEVWQNKEELVIDDGLVLKPYPSCGLTTRLIDCGIELHSKVIDQLHDIKSIDCRVSPLTLKVLKYPQPASGLEAKFSLEYCVAQSIISGEMKIQHFTDEHIQNSTAYKELINKVRHEIPKDMENLTSFNDEYASLTITFHSGESITTNKVKPKGYPENPLSNKEHQLKFNDCTKDFLDNNSQQDIYNKLLDLYRSEDVSVLIDQLNQSLTLIDPKI